MQSSSSRLSTEVLVSCNVLSECVLMFQTCLIGFKSEELAYHSIDCIVYVSNICPRSQSKWGITLSCIIIILYKAFFYEYVSRLLNIEILKHLIVNFNMTETYIEFLNHPKLACSSSQILTVIFFREVYSFLIPSLSVQI